MLKVSQQNHIDDCGSSFEFGLVSCIHVIIKQSFPIRQLLSRSAAQSTVLLSPVSCQLSAVIIVSYVKCQCVPRGERSRTSLVVKRASVRAAPVELYERLQ